MKRLLGFSVFPWVACVLVACSGDSGEETTDPGPTPEEIAAQEEAERLEAERLAAEQQLAEDTAEFCTEWAALYCVAEFECHPGGEGPHRMACEERVYPYCEERYQGMIPLDVAHQCFSAVMDNYDCGLTIDQLYWENCPLTDFVAAAAEGERCTYSQGQCPDGTRCEPVERDWDGTLLGCGDICRPVVGLGAECGAALCEVGLDCLEAEDDRGLTIHTCQVPAWVPEPEPEPTIVCASYEQYVAASETEEARCLVKSLPGDACGGAYGLGCLGSGCRSNEVCGNRGGFLESCSGGGGCDELYTCASELIDDSPRCRALERSCDEHPMLLGRDL